MAYVEYEADGKTIKARVWQKVDTLANWEANSLVIGPGEQAFVIDGGGTPINFKIGDGTKKFSELPWWISYDQGQYVQVVGNALPSPTVELGYSFVGPGTYTHAGGNVVAPEGRFSQIVYEGGAWSLKDMGALPTQPVSDEVIEGGSEAVSQDGVFKNTYIRPIADIKETKLIKGSDLLDGQVDLMSYAVQISGKIVNNTDGILNEASSILLSVPVEQVEYRIVTDKTAANVLSAVFLDVNGNQLKPLGSSNYAFSFNATGTFTPPSGAVVLVTNIKAGTFNILTIEGSSLFKTSMPETAKVKEGLIPDSVKYTNMLKVSPNLFDKSIAPTGYVASSDGSVTAGATSKRTGWLRLDDTKTHVAISGRTSSNGNIRFSADGSTVMKPVTDANVEWIDFNPVNNGKALNDVFLKPTGAKYIDATVVFVGSGSPDAVMVVNGNTLPTTYEPFGYSTIKDEYLPKSSQAGALTLEKTGNSYSVSGRNENGNELKTTFVNRLDDSKTSNPNFNLLADYVNGSKLKDSDDDVAPVNLFGSDNRNIGGNHGWSLTRKITLSAHGKTVSDIGSEYTDTVMNEFVIMRVPDPNTLIIGARNKATDGFSYNFPAPSGTLTYKANGANTAPMTGYTQSVEGNFYNTIKRNFTKVLVDGREIVDDGSYSGSTVKVIEDYDILDFDSVLAKLIAARPFSGYTVEPIYSTQGADKLINHSLVYEWNQPGKCLISLTSMKYRKVIENFNSVVQMFPLASASAKIYIPKSLPVGGVDYRLAPTYATPSSQVKFPKATAWEFPSNPPDRVLNFIPGNYGVHIGYIKDMGDSANRATIVDEALMLNTNKKIYPKAITPMGAVDAYSSYTITAFRNIVDLTYVGPVRTSKDMVIADGALYMFIDYHVEGLDSVTVPSEFVNRSIEVLEKSSNVNVLAKVATPTIRIKSDVGSGSYGFIVLKII